MSTPTLATPLAPARTVKRPAGAAAADPSTPLAPLKKRARPLTPHPSSDDFPRAPAADAAARHVFRLPALPLRVARALTPSTSTVAHSSSPPRLSSPLPSDAAEPETGAASAAAPTHVLVPGETLIFGRHRSSAPTAPRTTLAQAIPAGLRHLVAAGNAARIVPLPRGAHHASRVHAAVELVDARTVRVLVLGQNGARARRPGAARVRMAQGMRLDFGPAVELDFYGAKVCVAAPVPEAELVPRAAGVDAAEHADAPSSPMPPSSPPVEMMQLDQLDAADDDSDHAAEVAAPPSPIFARAPSSPLSDVGSPLPLIDEDAHGDAALVDDAGVGSSSDHEEEYFSPEPEARPSSPGLYVPPGEGEGDAAAVEPSIGVAEKAADKAVKAEQLDADASADADAEPAEPVLAPAPADVDIAALLASTVVFSGSSKLSLPDLVRSLLEPSLRSYGGEEQWSVWAGDELESNRMFGKVERYGKDSSGRPLLAHYFYAPDQDPDAARAKELGGLVRPLRAAQRGGGKAIDWRPVGMGRRRY